MVKHNGVITGTVPLKYANRPSTFEGKVEIQNEGPHEIIVFAYDHATGNTGVDRVTFIAAR